MEEQKKRNFTQLKKTMTLEELNKFCKKIAEEYAKGEAQYARTYFCKKYNITKSCFYKILEYSVVTNLVENIIVIRMLNKSVKNQNLHQKGAGGSSIAKYERMYVQRCRYIAMTFSNNEVNKFAIDFAENPNISKADIAFTYGINKKIADILLARAIEDGISDDKVVDAIERRSINNAKPENVEMTKQYFIAIRKKREANKRRNYP